MQGIFNYIRYGSGVFLYLISSFIVLSLSSKLCSDAVSFISFLLFSLIILPLVIQNKKLNVNSFHKCLTVFTLLFSTAFEVSYILIVFRASSDNATTIPGAFVFATIIFAVAFICAIFGSYTAIKLSNIIFIIPVVALLLSLLAYFKIGATIDIFRVTDNPGIIISIIKGVSASVLTFSDVYIISYMQKKENCYNHRKSKLAYIISLITIIFFTLVYKSIFGNSVSLSLTAPIMSAYGIILGSGLKEIFLFIYSSCVLYRMICKLSFTIELFNNIKQKKINNKLLCSIIFISAANAGALASIYNEVMLTLGIISLFLSLLSFVIAPLLKKVSEKSRKFLD